MIYHAFDCHPESIEYLANIEDESLKDVICPWKLIEVKKEVENGNEDDVDSLYTDLSLVEACIKMENLRFLKWKNFKFEIFKMESLKSEILTFDI